MSHNENEAQGKRPPLSAAEVDALCNLAADELERQKREAFPEKEAALEAGDRLVDQELEREALARGRASGMPAEWRELSEHLQHSPDFGNFQSSKEIHHNV